MVKIAVVPKPVVEPPEDLAHLAKLRRIEVIKVRLAYLESVSKERWAKVLRVDL